MIGMAEILEQSDSDTAAGLFWVSGLCGRLLGSQPSGSKRGIFCFHALGDNVFAIASTAASYMTRAWHIALKFDGELFRLNLISAHAMVPRCIIKSTRLLEGNLGSFEVCLNTKRSHSWTFSFSSAFKPTTCRRHASELDLARSS